jgi:hypothetical protein
MTIRLALILLAAVACAGCGTTRFMQNSAAPALTAPPAGQVLVNIFRPSGFAGGQDMLIFDGTAATMIGNLRGEERMQYVCPPGERMLLGWGEHKSGVAATLVADKTYDLICDAGMGFWKASVSLRPIPKVDERRAKIPTWEAKTRLMSFTANGEAQSYSAKKMDDVKRIAAEFKTAPTDRVMTLKADDCR